METLRISFQNPNLWIGGLVLLLLLIYYALKYIPKAITAFILILSVGIYYLPSAIESLYRLAGREIDIILYLPPPGAIPEPLDGFYSDYLNKIDQPRILPLVLLAFGILLSVDLAKNIPNQKLRRVCRDFCYYFTISLVLASVAGLITGWGIWEFLFVVIFIALVLSLLRATPAILRGFWMILRHFLTALSLLARYLALIAARMILAAHSLMEYPRQLVVRARRATRALDQRLNNLLETADSHLMEMLQNERLERRDQPIAPRARKGLPGDKPTTESHS
jgi:hypothetical protein